MEKPVAEVAAALLHGGWMLATAESCTGGLVGAALTGQPGSSAWYLGGLVAYANTLKTGWLGVPEVLLARHGAVSPETAVSMAEAICARTGAHFGVSITGIAGPDGGSLEKPVGLVYLGVHGPQGTVCSRHLYEGTRSEIRRCATADALREVLAAVQRAVARKA